MTVRRLLSHTAGLSVSGYLGYEPEVPLPSLEEQLASGPDAAEGEGAVRISYPPGEEVHYSGGGYTVLPLLIEEVSGQSFAVYMQQNVLEPLGQTHSTFDPASQVIQQAATPYGADGQALPHYRFAAKAAGGLYTTPADLARFVAAAMRGSSGEPAGRRVLASRTIDEMFSPPAGATTRMGPTTVYSLGLGYHLDPVLMKQDTRVVGHDGSNRGWKSTFLTLPAEGNGIAILTNSERGGAFNERVGCRWVEWATGSTTPSCLTSKCHTTPRSRPPSGSRLRPSLSDGESSARVAPHFGLTARPHLPGLAHPTSWSESRVAFRSGAEQVPPVSSILGVCLFP